MNYNNNYIKRIYLTQILLKFLLYKKSSIFDIKSYKEKKNKK